MFFDVAVVVVVVVVVTYCIIVIIVLLLVIIVVAVVDVVVIVAVVVESICRHTGHYYSGDQPSSFIHGHCAHTVHKVICRANSFAALLTSFSQSTLGYTLCPLIVCYLLVYDLAACL